MDNEQKLRLCVFPNDPIEAYYNKGEIKARYFNPNNLFTEIHVISTFDHDIEEEKVMEIAGSAKLFIHNVGKINLKNYKKEKDRIIKLVRSINPHVIRVYNPLIQGWLAAKSSEALKKPLVVSLHINYDTDVRGTSKNKGLLSSLKLKFTSKNIEPYVLKTADKVICVHNSVAKYAKNKGAKNVEVIYNRVYLDQFSPKAEKALSFDKPIIIYVARLTKQKNQECTIKAIKDLDVKLLLLGDGPDYGYLKNLAHSLNCDEKVKFIRSVPNSEIHKYYSSADIFIAPVKDRGIGISFLEAMASGLPVILRKIADESEELEEAAYMVENNPQNFSLAIKKILSDEKLRRTLQKKSLDMAKRFNGKSMEEREYRLYTEVMRIHK